MNKLFLTLLTAACLASTSIAYAQTAAPAQPAATPNAAPAISPMNSEKAVAPEQVKPNKKAKKKNLKKKKARHAKAQ